MWPTTPCLIKPHFTLSISSFSFHLGSLSHLQINNNTNTYGQVVDLDHPASFYCWVCTLLQPLLTSMIYFIIFLWFWFLYVSCVCIYLRLLLITSMFVFFSGRLWRYCTLCKYDLQLQHFVNNFLIKYVLCSLILTYN